MNKMDKTNLKIPDRVRRVVVLVDSRARDLPVAALLAHHLKKQGVECFLEPLESYRAVLGAFRPDMIVFNHLTAFHLEQYSKRLKEMGVLTAVLSNEGINYDEDDLKFNSGKHHGDAHIDRFFCWNEPHKEALIEVGAVNPDAIRVVGVPRFDFYFEPWSRVFFEPSKAKRARPRILLCTNFSVAKFWELPKEQGDKFFSAWADRIPIYKNYWQAIEDHFKAREQIFERLDQLVKADRYELILRPHPREDAELYQKWYEGLPEDQRRHVVIDSDSSINSAILAADLEISCETCTTAMESWIAGKPTVEMVFFKNPMFFHPEHAAASSQCEAGQELPGMIDDLLDNGEADDVVEARRKHLSKWCDTPKGDSCLRLSTLIAEAVKELPEPDWSKLNATDRRRALKLKLTRSIGVAYHWDPFMPLKMVLNSGRYSIKNFAYQKSIRPEDVREMMAKLEEVLARSAQTDSKA